MAIPDGPFTPRQFQFDIETFHYQGVMVSTNASATGLPHTISHLGGFHREACYVSQHHKVPHGSVTE